MSGLKDILLNVGAVAGFAAILGLAVLAMLYFSQARDVRRLREWAGREPERAEEVELRAQQIASTAIAEAYESMALRQSEAIAAQQIAADAGMEVPAPAPPTGDPPLDRTADPLVSEETQAHDVVAHEFGGEEAPPIEPAVDQPVVGAEDAPPLAPPPADPFTVAAAANPGADETVVQPVDQIQPDQIQPDGTGSEQPPGETADVPAPPSDPGVPAVPEAPSATDAPQPMPRPSTPAAARASVPLPPLPPLDTSEFQAVHSPTAPLSGHYLTGTTTSGSFEELEREDQRRSRVPFAVAGVLVALFAIVLIGTQLLGGSDSTDQAKGTGGSPNNRPQVNTSKDRNQRINRAAVTVAVLNGTDTAGIAATAAAGLNKAGFTDTTTGNLNDGTVHPTSTVFYAQGSKQEAEEVAKELSLPDIKPATEAVIAAGGSVPVIVVLGASFQQ